eukprot:g3471.t1
MSDNTSSTKKEEITRARERDAFWFVEDLTPDFQLRMSLKRIMYDGRSKFQRLQVVETGEFGKTLLMDGCTQSSQNDEHIYHETLVHPSMLMHENPKKVFIGGGGEFATAREVLRHKSVERCVMIDLDKDACDICRKELPEWNNGAYEDPRLHVEYVDAKKWLENTEEKFDVIIMDICDPIEAGPGYLLYTKEFYTFLRSRLNKGGVIVTQSGPGAHFNVKKECFTVIHSTLRSVFGSVAPYTVDIPSFGCDWGFNMVLDTCTQDATKQGTMDSVLADLMDIPMSKIDALIEKRINGKLKFLDGISWRGLFGTAKEIRTQCKEETRVMTKDEPVFMYTA